MNLQDIDQKWAIAEFDRLWESGQSKHVPHRMRELLALMEPEDNGPSERFIKTYDVAVGTLNKTQVAPS